MKTFKSFAYLMAIAIVSVGLASCNSNDPEEQQGTPSYNGQTAKTQFVINLPDKAANSGALRMPGNTVQYGTTEAAVAFLGMDNIVLIPYAKNGAITTTDTRLGQNIVLPGVSPAPDNSFSTFTHNLNAQVFNDVKIPLGTYHFLFYGHAKNVTLGDEQTTWDTYTQAQKFQYGILHHTGLTALTPASIEFSPVQIYPTGAEHAKATALMAYLTSIANVTDAGGAKWKVGGDAAEIGWKDLYDNFITLKAGSSASIQAMLIDLYESVNTQADVNTMAKAIKTAILNPTYVTNAATLNVTPAIAGTPTFADAINGFPSNQVENAVPGIGLPDGAAAVQWNSTASKFELKSSYEWAAANSSETMDVATLDKYIYPPSLYYYVNSGLLAEDAKKSDQYNTTSSGAANSAAAWTAIKGGLYTSGQTSVIGSTQSVAITDQIQYGVGRMDLKLKASGASLADSKAVQHNIATGTGLKPTGVLIGGQGPVKFDFVPTAAGTYTIWDPTMHNTTYTLSTTDYAAEPLNFTLAFETLPNVKVRVAVEFENNMEDFFGVNGQLIPLGTKFYVIAELDPTDAGAVAHENTKHNVFCQDFATTVKLNMTTLAKAYNVVPDLRTPELELGFSVNLEWQQGYEFEINI